MEKVGVQKSTVPRVRKPTTGLSGRYFLSMTTGVMKVAGHMISYAMAVSNYKMATSLRADHRVYSDTKWSVI